MRLKGRAIVLEVPAADGGRRLAIVQADLGAVSPLLHALVANETASLGVDRAHLLLAATHTHGGPAGHMPDPFYSSFGGARPGFDEAFTRRVASLLARAVDLAVKDLDNAKIGRASSTVHGLAYNRSYVAWVANETGASSPDASSVDSLVPVLRIDHVNGKRSTPRALIATASVHGTAVGPDNDLYHSDLFGYAAQSIRRGIATESGANVVPLVFAGAEGDASPLPPRNQGFRKAERAGERLADAVLNAWRTASLGTPADLGAAYREVSFRNAPTSAGSTCAHALVGVPTLGGAEDGRSDLYGHAGVYEGRRRHVAGGCHSPKVPALGSLQRGARDRELEPPDWAPFQLLRIGSVASVVALPGEPTRQVGLELMRRAGPGSMVVGLANGYVGYFTTALEYAEQQYEGGSTFWGPRQSALAYDTVAGLAREASVADGGLGLGFGTQVFRPWMPRAFISAGGKCSSSDWRPVALQAHRGPPVFKWRGQPERQWCDGGMPVVAVECGPGDDALATAVTDDTGHIAVRSLGSRDWSATLLAPRALMRGHCRFTVRDANGRLLVRSDAFAAP